MSERSIKAAALLRDLNALDVHEPLRIELELAGVPAHRIEALYPRTFDPIAEGLVERMRPYQVGYLSRLNDHMKFRIETKSNTINSLSRHLLDQWEQINRSPREGYGTAQLHAFLVKNLGGKHFDYTVADNFNALMLRTWWLAMHNAELPRHLQVNSELNAIWVGDNMLPNLCDTKARP